MYIYLHIWDNIHEVRKLNNRIQLRKKMKRIEEIKKSNITTNIQDNLSTFKEIYSPKINLGIVFREFELSFNGKTYICFALFIEGISDSDSINDSILKPLMIREYSFENLSLEDAIEKKILLQSNISSKRNINDIIVNVNLGNCALFIDSLDTCFICDVKKNEHRTISQPVNEVTIQGPHSGFVESIRSNASLLRKVVNDENLIYEKIEIGKRSHTSCIMGYISNIANPDIVNNVRNRLKNVSIDYLLDSGQLEQLIEDHPLMLLPQTISTERPDKIASHLAEGRICIIVDNSPFVLAVPCTFWDMFHTPEDYNLRFQQGTFIRIIRLIAYFCSIFLPGIYIAMTNFHVSLLPTDLLFSIAAIKESLPFPLIIEILVMELSLELIREAGARMPNSIGSSLGIVGAVLLGQATVDAHLVSPMLILIVAITAISSFATPSYRLAFSFRILRFVYIIFAAFMGFLGILFFAIVHLVILCSIYCYGIPYMLSLGKYTKQKFRDGIVLAPIWLDNFRPPFMEPLDIKKAKRYARQWNIKKGK